MSAWTFISIVGEYGGTGQIQILTQSDGVSIKVVEEVHDPQSSLSISKGSDKRKKAPGGDRVGM